MKKVFCLLLIAFVFVSSPIVANRSYSFAEGLTTSQIQTELSEDVQNQLNNLDMSELDELMQELVNNLGIINGSTFSQKIVDIIGGKLNIDASSFVSYIAELLLDDVMSFLPYVCIIISIAILYSMVSASHSGKNKSINDVIHFVCYSTIVVIVVVWVCKLLNLTTITLNAIKEQMQLIFPLLLTLLTALGGKVAVSVYQPAMAMLSSSVIGIFIDILLPIFTFTLIFTIVSNLAKNIKLNKFSEFFGSCFKWIIGVVLMIFSSFVSIQGLMAGSIDTISLKTAKYTIKSAVPIIGGFLSDGVSLIMVSSVLIKNAIGVGGLLMLFGSMLVPLVKIVVLSLLLKLASAVLEPISDSRISGFVASISKSIQMLIALILGVGFMYFLMIGLVMCSTNIF